MPTEVNIFLDTLFETMYCFSPSSIFFITDNNVLYIILSLLFKLIISLTYAIHLYISSQNTPIKYDFSLCVNV